MPLRPVQVAGEYTVPSRYEIRRLIGAGGSATVHEVFDSLRGTTLAMKRLSPEAAGRQSTVLLFRREYRTLRELSHPSIARVFDYGLHDGTPYYTMDLTPGTDVRSLAPLPFEEACAILRDVVSALSLLHARRLLHRDVSASNVRRTPEMRGKLLDFGALCPMGVAPEVVGTPPFVAPESLDGRPLDARADLYAVGALAYFLLTGQHAYPASRFADLKRAWSSPVPPPSAVVADVPESLDALVLSLLALNPLARPAAASEVFDRLGAIAHLEQGESPAVALGYLSTPTLVGRDGVVSRFKKRLLSADRGRGSALLIEGERGLGRSRLLAGLVTEARLANMVTLCASGAGGRAVPFGVAQTLAKRLLEADSSWSKDVATDIRTMETLGLSRGSELRPSGAMLTWRGRVEGVVAWFADVTRRVPLLLAIDDVDEVDDASMAVVAKLAEAAPSRRLLVVATARSGAGAAPFRRLGGSHRLRPLRPHETRALLGSIFDEAPGVERIATWVHQLSAGSPQVVVELSQHLVDRALARHEGGTWVLPTSLAELELPADLDEVIHKRVAGLGPSARVLAGGLSLCVESEPLLLEEYGALLGGAEQEEVLAALDELVSAHVLTGNGTAYAFVHDAMKAAVERGMTKEARAVLHRRLADIHGASPRASIVAALHLLLAGDEASAFATLARYTVERDDSLGQGLRLLRSPEGATLHERLLEWGLSHRAPLSDLLRIAVQFFGNASVAFGEPERFIPTVMAELERETGLAYWDELSHVEDPVARMRACVARATEISESLPKATRGLPPREAIAMFSACTAHVTGVYSARGEVQSIVRLLPNMERLGALSPAVDIAARTAGFSARSRRGWTATAERNALIERLRAPVPDLAEPTRLGLRLITTYYQGVEEAVLGDPKAFVRADEIEAEAPYSALGWQLRQIAHLFFGRERRAEECRAKRDVALVGQRESERHVDATLTQEANAWVILGDLTGVKRVIPALRERAARHPAWQPHCLFVEGAHEALRGDPHAALDQMLRAIAMITPGEHYSWLLLEVKVAQLLTEVGREQESRERILAALEVCRERPMMPPYVDLLEASLALVEAKLGEGEMAGARVAECVRRAEARAAAGILALDLYAIAARVALVLRDEAAFERASKRVVEMSAGVDGRAIASRLSELFRVSIGAGFEPVDAGAHQFRRRGRDMESRIRTELELCAGAGERAARALGVVLRHANVARGHLYLHQPEGFVLAASRSPDPPPLRTEEQLFEWLQAFRRESGDADTTADDASAHFGDRYKLVPLVADDGGSSVVPAIAVIECDAPPRTIPERVLRELSIALLDAGDAPRA